MITRLRRSGMARILKGSHSFTCTPHIHPLTAVLLTHRSLERGGFELDSRVTAP